MISVFELVVDFYVKKLEKLKELSFRFAPLEVKADTKKRLTFNF